MAISFVSIETDAKILNEVQDRFDVNITELPDEIELSSYSEFFLTDIFIFFFVVNDVSFWYSSNEHNDSNLKKFWFFLKFSLDFDLINTS